MASGPFDSYSSPGVVTETRVQQDASGPPVGARVPVLIGVGAETLRRTDFELVRGSSASADQQIVNESAAGRFVVDNTNPDAPILGDSTGAEARFRVVNYPIVAGDGRGVTTNDPQDITVTVDGELVSPAAVNGELGIVTLQLPPAAGADVRVTYFFNRTDTQTTDDVSSQVSSGAAVLKGAQVGPYTITSGVNDTFIVSVNGGAEATVTLTSGTRTAAQVVLDINSALITGLTATVDADNQGNDRVQLSSQGSLVLGQGTSNATLGFLSGQSTTRNTLFYTYQAPIVTGDNGGITSTNPTDVTVLVDDVAVDVLAVDGANGAVTLAQAPEVGSVVEITYFFNNFQDTFDTLPDTDVRTVLRVGISPGRRDFVQGVDYVLDTSGRILWGAAVTVASGVHTTGTEFFDDSQITATLVDNRVYLEAATRFVDRSVSPAQISDFTVVLDKVPTTGNGRSTPLDADLFDQVNNDRSGLPTSRPDLVQIYHGVTLQEAIAEGARTVVNVDPTTRRVTVSDPIPPDHNVWATYYYSRLQDDTITLQVNTQSTPSTPGQYTVRSSILGAQLFGVQFGTKSAGTFTANFPSGSETNPDAFISGTSGVNETVTVTFTDNEALPAVLTNNLPGTYDIYPAASDTLYINVNGSDITVDLNQAAFGVLVSDAFDDGATFNIVASTNDTFDFEVDGTAYSATLPTGAAVSLADIVEAIWRAVPTTATLTGTQSEPFAIVLATNDAFDLTVNGTLVNVTLTAGAAQTANDVLTDITTALGLAGLTVGDTAVAGNDVNVTVVGGAIKIDASMTLEIGTGNANATLGFTDNDLVTNILVAQARDGGADKDRILLRSKVTPGGPDELSLIRVLDGNANATLGFDDFASAAGTEAAVNKAATLLSDPISATDITQLAALTGASFIVSIDGVESTITGFGGVASVADIATVIDTALGATATVIDVDDTIRITSATITNNSSIAIGAGTANEFVGFTLGDAAAQRRVETEEIVAVLNATAADWTAPVSGTEFIADAFASVFTVQGEGDYLRLETFSTGATTSFTIGTGADTVLNDTGIGFEAADSASGVAATDGFDVTSSSASGSSGSGVVGQTYVDDTTGLTFTLLEEAGGNYPVGESFTFVVSNVFETSVSRVVKAVGGAELVVTSTEDVGIGDTATVTTFNSSGQEPANGDFYYITYDYNKTDFSTQLFTSFAAIQAAYGDLSPENPLTLAAYFAILNGAVVLGLKQVPRATGLGQASSTSFITALTELGQPLTGGVRPDLLVPLTSDPTVMAAYVNHAAVQASPRYKQERRCIFGVASGTRPEDARALARSLNSARALLLYPDSAIVSLPDGQGGEVQSVVDGTYLAAAMAGVLANPQFDVAQPVTRRTLVGFTRINRQLDEPTKNALAVDGVLVLENVGLSLRVRDGVTTDPSSVFTRIPSIVAIQDFVQQQTRAALERYIGTKFLVSRAQDVEQTLSGLLNTLVEQNIINAFTGVSATPDANDPTLLRVVAFYQPVFPLKYIQVTFTITANGIA